MNVYVGELYKEVEYIQSSGTQYIDTGYIPSNNTKIEMSMGGFNSSTSSNSLFGARYSWNTDASIGRGFGWSVNASTSPYGYGGMFGRRYSSGNDNFNVFNWGDGGNHILSLDQSGFYQDGVKKYTPNTVTFTSPVNLYIFALNDNGTLAERTNYKLYYFKVWNSGTLVRDFIPCYRVSDNVIGLFDKVENKFYTNAGTGIFTKGNDVKVFQAELKNAYIGEVWTPGSNTLAYYKFDGNLNDSSWNNRNLSMYTGSFSFSTLSSGQHYCQLNTNAEATFNNMPFSRTAYTISGYCLWDSTNNTYQKIIFDLVAGDNYFPRFYTGGPSTINKINTVVSFNEYGVAFAANTRFHLVTVYDNNVVKSYINGNLIHSLTYSNASTTGTLYLNGTSNYSSNYRTNGKISELILENKARTATEITNYYNLTKSNYGL